MVAHSPSNESLTPKPKDFVYIITEAFVMICFTFLFKDVVILHILAACPLS